MAPGHAEPKVALGFLTVVDHPQHGLFGGYLLLNTGGRPMEFHCTAPIKPNRAQEILYGPTLEPFLYGEQIGRALLERAKTEPCLVLTDRWPVLAVRDHISLPVALVLSASSPASNQGDEPMRPDAAGAGGPDLIAFQVGRSRLAVPEGSDGDRRQISQRLSELPESFDLTEPFARIREAIEEAQQAVRQPHVQRSEPG